MDRLYGARRPLDEDPNQRPLGEISRVGFPEIPDFGPLTVLVGTFSDYDVVFSESRLSIYTEQHVTVERILTPDRPNVWPGNIVTILEEGGAALRGARTIRYLIDPRSGVLELKHRYLLFLQYFSAGDFFVVVKSWELVDGKAMPCWREDVDLAMRGQSRYAGMEEEPFIQLVEQTIQTQPLQKGDR
jgi:hypothetical protein